MEEGISILREGFCKCFFLLVERVSCGAAEGFWSMVTLVSYLLLGFILSYGSSLVERFAYGACYCTILSVLGKTSGNASARTCFLVTVIYSYISASIPNDLYLCEVTISKEPLLPHEGPVLRIPSSNKS